VEQQNGGRQANLLVLGKITSILDSFTLARPSLTLAEIRESTGLPASTVQRLVANLVSVGLLDRDAQGYRIGVRMAYWAAPATQGVELVRLAQPELDGLRDEIGESVAIFRESAGHRVCIALAETRQILRIHMRVGTVTPMHVGSSGRVILAWTPGLLDTVLRGPLEAVAPGTITDPDVLRAAVEQTVADRYAITHDERETGSSGLSAPVFGSRGELLGALNVFGPSSRLTPERLRQLVPSVVEGAERLTRIIGGRHPEG
jgi:DNA-binding IclR family transcriptional regulator